MSIALLNGILRYWPFASSSKELIFMSELVEILETCEITELKPYIEKIFKRLIKCMTGLNLQITDRAVSFF